MASRILLSESNDPHFNLAVEDCIFRSMPADQRVLFLWRNADTVVIGRAQNPWKECNINKIEQDKVTLVRRQSGGGAVFHEGYANGRNDLVVGEGDNMRKFSCSAYKETKDRGFHHGTLLLNADLSRLANYLNPDPKKLQSKGITSVRSRVTNLDSLRDDIDHNVVCEAIIQAFSEHFDETPVIEYISPEIMPDLPGFVDKFAQQQSWDWNYGKSPQFTHTLDERFKWGGVELHLDSKNAQITAVQTFTDSLFPDPIEQLADRLVGVMYRPDAVAACVDSLIDSFPDHKANLEEMRNWLVKAIS